MPSKIPLTPIAARYANLPETHSARLEVAQELLASPDQLAREFLDSVEVAERYFDDRDRKPSEDPFHEERTAFGDHVKPGLASTPSLCRWFEGNRKRTWKVLGDSERRLGFSYLDRELVSTRAPGELLADGRSTKHGPRMDLLLMKSDGRVPIIGEVKLTTKSKQGKWTPDKDPFYALIQALASAAYVLPRNQFARLGLHDPTGLLG